MANSNTTTTQYEIDSNYIKCPSGVFVVPPNVNRDEATTIEILHVCISNTPPDFPAKPIYADDFDLQWDKKESQITDPLEQVSLKVTIKATQWECETVTRKRIRNNFVAVIETLDELEYPLQDKPRILAPSSTQIIMRRIAESLAAPLADTAYFLSGFNTGINSTQACPYIDLLPGMQVLVQPEINQFLGPGSPANRPISAGAFTFPVCGTGRADGTRLIGFDPFLAAISPPTISNKPVSKSQPQIAIGGLIDLQAAGVLRRWWRLHYPTKLPPAHESGDIQLGNSITLIGADSRVDLEAATESFQNGHAAASTKFPLWYGVFRGRPTVIPQVQIMIDRVKKFVSSGTTIRSIVEDIVLSNVFAWDLGSDLNQRFDMSRMFTESGKPLPESKEVTFKLDRAATHTDPEVYDLPIAFGDVVTVKSWYQ
ncbi:MAG: hypothetical protein ACRDRE_03735 [Pseudonocardiaceae bacterium]